MSDTQDLTQLATRLDRSVSWTQKNWRTIAGLPAPFIGAAKGQHPRWRTSDLDRFFRGEATNAGPAPANDPFPRAPVPKTLEDGRAGGEAAGVATPPIPGSRRQALLSALTG